MSMTLEELEALVVKQGAELSQLRIKEAEALEANKVTQAQKEKDERIKQMQLEINNLKKPPVDPNAETTPVDPNAETTPVDPNVQTTPVDPEEKSIIEKAVLDINILKKNSEEQEKVIQGYRDKEAQEYRNKVIQDMAKESNIEINTEDPKVMEMFEQQFKTHLANKSKLMKSSDGQDYFVDPENKEEPLAVKEALTEFFKQDYTKMFKKQATPDPSNQPFNFNKIPKETLKSGDTEIEYTMLNGKKVITYEKYLELIDKNLAKTGAGANHRDIDNNTSDVIRMLNDSGIVRLPRKDEIDGDSESVGNITLDLGGI